MRRSSRMSLRQPNMERHETSFCTKTNHCENEHHTHQMARKTTVEESGEFKRTGMPSQQKKHHQKKGRSDMSSYKINPPGPTNGIPLMFKHNQKKRRKGHHLPGDQEQQGISGQHNQQHACNKKIEKEPALTEVVRILERLQITGTKH